MTRMEFRHLQSFAAAAERQSFTRAAESLGLTQAAVSQHVAALEKSLNVLLFQRVGRTVVLSAAGRRLHSHARNILDLVDEASRDVGQVDAEMTGTLRIATSTVPAELVLPSLLAEFRQLHPKVREKVTVSDSGSAAESVALGEADLGFVGELPRRSQLRSRTVRTDKLVLVVSPQHAFSRSKRTTVSRLRREPLIVREPGSGSRRCVEQALEAQGLPPGELSIVMETNSNDAIRAAVENGLGAAFLSRATISHEIDEGRLVPVSVAGVRPMRKLYLITASDSVPSTVVREFLSFADQRAQSA